MDYFKPLYKSHRRASCSSLKDVLDTRKIKSKIGPYTVTTNHQLPPELCESSLQEAYAAYGLYPPLEYTVISISELPGLHVVTGLITPELQQRLTHEAVTEYLADPRHLTNLDAHHEIKRPMCLFQEDPLSSTISNQRIRNKGLRWVTLGGQYNWTSKEYPTFTPGAAGWPEFPPRLASFVAKAFGTAAQAAIVNYYSEGDILSPHKDVAERSQKPLISISLGCDCIFYTALGRLDCQPLATLLHSGDVVVMAGQARQAYHGVGRVFSGSGPEYLEASCVEAGFAQWITDHRININIRQMV